MSKHLTSRSNWNLEMLVFMEGGKPEYSEKNPRSKDENQQQTQPTYEPGPGTEPGPHFDTLVEGECSHHCAIPAPMSGSNTTQYNRFSLEVRLKKLKIKSAYCMRIKKKGDG